MNWLETKIPPPVVLLLLAALGWWLAHTVPAGRFDFAAHRPLNSLLNLPVSLVLSAVLAVAGLLLELLPSLAFLRARTTVNPLRPASSSQLVTTGIYRYTRNPMYLGQALLLTSWAVYLQHGLAFLMPVLFVLYITRFQILPEERFLSSRFPQEFAQLCRQARRWI